MLQRVGREITSLPKDLSVHRTVDRLIKRRRQMADGEAPIDWAMGEHLAFGTLLAEGFPVRLSGQDSERGTFSQRHSVITDQEDGHTYTPLANIFPDQARFEVINSMLSEEAVLGFEYGYSLAEPMALTLWEAQFGDFANGAQVVIDQFISSGESKWLRMSGLVLLLPHGYEGQGPEHSSARLERFLQLSAEDNWQVVNCTTPANYFHVLRRQMHRKFRKPLVIMTPKSLLRHKRVISDLSDLASGSTFHRVLWDNAQSDAEPGAEAEARHRDTTCRHVFGQGLLRPAGCQGQWRAGRRLSPAYGTALPVSGKGPGGGAVALPAGGDGLVSGRAAQHGRLALCRGQHRGSAQDARFVTYTAYLLRTRAIGVDGNGARFGAQEAAGRAGDGGVDGWAGAHALTPTELTVAAGGSGGRGEMTRHAGVAG